MKKASNASFWLTTDSPAMLPAHPLFPQQETFGIDNRFRADLV